MLKSNNNQEVKNGQEQYEPTGQNSMKKSKPVKKADQTSKKDSLWEKLNQPIGKSRQTPKGDNKGKTSQKTIPNRTTYGFRNPGKQGEKELSRRELRRKRRHRNQVMVVVSLVLILCICFFFGLWGVKQLMGGFRQNSYNINNGVASNETEETLSTEEFAPVEESMNEVAEDVRDELDDVVDAYLADMTLDEKIAQMFVLTPESLTGIPGPANVAGSKTEEALKNSAVGGVMFQSKNFSTKEGTKEMVAKTATMAQRPLFTIACEDGGGNGTLSSIGELQVSATPSFKEIGASGDANQAYQAGVTIGSYLKEYGFSLDISPIADMAGDDATSGLAGKTFGTDQNVVAEMVSNYVRGLQETGVSACLTHFPGHGSTSGDSTDGVAFTERTIADMKTYELVPFQAGIDAGAQFVMVGHVSAGNVTGDSTPASLSPIFVTDLLRNEMHFKGVVITQRMDVPAITGYYTTEEAVLKAVNAGVDIILCPDNYDVARNALKSAVEDGTISEERINESLHRIYRVKLSEATNS